MTTCVASTLIDITQGKLFTTGLILSYILHCMLMIKKTSNFFLSQTVCRYDQHAIHPDVPEKSARNPCVLLLMTSISWRVTV